MDEIENDTLGVTTPNPENPFKTPNASTVSLNTPNDSAIMTEASSTDPLATPTKAAFDKRRSKSHPPPKPLDLPEPRSPPPRTGTPHANTPPEPIPPPTIAAAEIHEEELPEKRWWTDWLCGCRERQEDQVSSSRFTHVPCLLYYNSDVVSNTVPLSHRPLGLILSSDRSLHAPWFVFCFSYAVLVVMHCFIYLRRLR